MSCRCVQVARGRHGPQRTAEEEEGSQGEDGSEFEGGDEWEEEAGDDDFDPASTYRVALDVSEDGGVGVDMRTYAEYAEAVEMEALTNRKLEYLESLWALEEDAEDEYAFERADDDEAEASGDGSDGVSFEARHTAASPAPVRRPVSSRTRARTERAAQLAARLEQEQAGRAMAALKIQQERAADLRQKLDDGTDAVRALEGRIAAMQDKAAECERLPVIPVVRLNRINHEIGTALDDLQEKIRSVQELQEEHYEAVLERSRMEAALARVIELGAEEGGALEGVTMGRVRGAQGAGEVGGTMLDVTRNIARMERKGAELYQTRRDHNAELRREAEREAEAARKRVVQAARDGRLRAILRIREKAAVLNERLDGVKGREQSALDARAAALVQLKTSLRAAEAEVRSRHMARERRLLDRKRQEDAEFESLKDAGENPYEVFRRRKIQQRRERRQRQQRRKLENAQMKIAEMLLKEQTVLKKRADAARREREYKEKYNREMGVAAVDERMRRWMIRKTKDGLPLLNPTGHAPFYPSDAMTVRDWKFGTGRASFEQIRAMQARYRQISIVNELVPQKYRPPAPNDFYTIEFKDDSGDSDGSADVHAVPEYPAVWSEEGKDPSAGRLGGQKLSKAERKRMQELREKQRAAIVKPQVVMGREFKGAAFLPSPREVVFEDFDVGKTYSRRVVLTNVSWAQSSFKVLDMPNDVYQYFSLRYKPPGYMSAGMTCSVEITFQPLLNRDIDTHIPLLGETGPFQIPVRCRRKKAMMLLSPDTLSFPGLALGASETRKVVIKNKGALPVDFIIEVAESHLEVHKPEHGDAAGDNDNDNDDPEAARSQRPSEAGSARSARSARAARNSSGALDFARSTGGKSRAGIEPTLSVKMSRNQARLADMGLTCSVLSGSIKPYGGHAVTFTYAPEQVSDFSSLLRLRFVSPDFPKQEVPSLDLRVNGSVRPNPVSVDHEVIDYRCMVYGQAYTAQLVVRNSGNSAMKCLVVRPHELNGILEVSPAVGFVQAGETFNFTLKLRPQVGMVERLVAADMAEPMGDGPDCQLRLPLKLSAPQQPLPVPFTIEGMCTTSDVAIDPPVLDFGQCYTGESAGLRVKLTNLSRLPQKFGFIRLRPGVTVSPGNGFGTLLPFASAEVTVAFRPTLQGLHEFTTDMRTLLGRTFAIECRAKAEVPPLEFSSNHLVLATSEIGRRTRASVLLRNVSRTPQRYQMAMPAAWNLKASPNVGMLKAGESMRIEVEYTPLAEHFEGGEAAAEGKPAAAAEDDAPQDGDGEKPAEAPADGSGGDGGDGADKGDALAARQAPVRIQSMAKIPDRHLWNRRQSFTIPCFIYTRVRKSDKKKGRGGVPPAIHLQVDVSCKQPELLVDKSLPFNAELGYHEMRFGQVPLGERVVKSMQVLNMGTAEASLLASPLGPEETFSLVNALRPLEAGMGRFLLISYKPTQRGRHREVLTLSTERSHVRVALIGEGVTPTFEVDKDFVDLGDVFKGEASTRHFTITNTSDFPMKYRLLLGKGAHTNVGGSPVFVVKPSEGTIQASGSQQVEVNFLPDHEYLYFENKLRVEVPNQDRDDDVSVMLYGRCWEKGMYIVGHDREVVAEDPFKYKQLSKFEGLRPAINLQLTLPKDVTPGESGEAQLEVGNLQAHAGSAPGEFVVMDMDAAAIGVGWSVSPTRDTVMPGSRRIIKFTFNCPEDPSKLNLAYMEMGGWIDTHVDVCLKGGYPPPPDEQGTMYRVKIKANIKPKAAKRRQKKEIRFTMR
ncbi:unnamed protein product [Pedinophyceae sp. YPF-701]|nr:unnamed protein product [Pedinophyceae sp. YPF-701]